MGAWLTVSEYAARTGKAKQSVYRSLKRGTIESKPGENGAVLVWLDDPQQAQPVPDAQPDDSTGLPPAKMYDQGFVDLLKATIAELKADKERLLMQNAMLLEARIHPVDTTGEQPGYTAENAPEEQQTAPDDTGEPDTETGTEDTQTAVEDVPEAPPETDTQTAMEPEIIETDGPQTAVVGADPEPETVPEVMPGQKIDRDQDSRLTLAQRIRVLFTGRL